MKAKDLLLFGVMMIPIVLNAQNDYWLQKGYNAPNAKEKIECFTKSIEKEGPSVEAYFSRASAELEIRDFKAALSDYTKIIEFDSTDAGAFYSRGFAKHHYVQDYRGALADYSRAFELDSANASYVSLMGLLNSLLKDYPNAIKCYKQGLKICAQNNNILKNHGYAGISKVYGPADLKKVKKYKDIQPDIVDINIGLALAYYYTHDRVNAIKYFEQAINLKPGLKEDPKVLESYEEESCVIYPKDEKALKKMLKKLK